MMKFLKIFVFFISLAFCFPADCLPAEPTWRFLLLADWHQAEKYIKLRNNPARLKPLVDEDIATIRMLNQNYGGELIVMPGDCNAGHWDRPEFINEYFPGSTPEAAILRAGQLCYSGLIDSFKKGGYSKLLIAIGDHELGGDPWRAGSAVARCQPQFRKAFADEINRNADGMFLYEKRIGKAVSRPLGTPYAETSYACRHKNVLFVTLDVFHQENYKKRIGKKGTVASTISGLHLGWLETVLLEARKDPEIDHIFVQSHLPVMYPVRKVNSSGMFVDGGPANPFWKILRNYEVDLYFAGDAHANTVTQDPKSDLVQIVSRGNFFSNFQTIDISRDRIDIVCFNHTGTKTSDGKYEISGRLQIDKSGSSVKLAGEGELALLDPEARHLYFDFEDQVYLEKHPILGLKKASIKEEDTILRGVRCEIIIPNKGAFGPHYSALSANVELVQGVRGKAGVFDATSRMGVFAMGPQQGGHAASYALWIKTSSVKNQILINSGLIWSSKLTNFFNLHLNRGRPEVMISERQRLYAKDVQINDGRWHHIAVVMPSDSCLLSEVRLYVDGQPVRAGLVGADRRIYSFQAMRLGFGGLNYSTEAFDALPVEPFVGEMDEISVWTRSLSSKEIESLIH